MISLTNQSISASSKFSLKLYDLEPASILTIGIFLLLLYKLSFFTDFIFGVSPTSHELELLKEFDFDSITNLSGFNWREKVLNIELNRIKQKGNNIVDIKKPVGDLKIKSMEKDIAKRVKNDNKYSSLNPFIITSNLSSDLSILIRLFCNG